MKMLVKPPQSELKKKNPTGKLIVKSTKALRWFHFLPVNIPPTVTNPKIEIDRRNTAITRKNIFVEAMIFNPVKVMANGIWWSVSWRLILEMTSQSKNVEIQMRDIPPSRLMTLIIASKTAKLPEPSNLLLGEESCSIRDFENAPVTSTMPMATQKKAHMFGEW